MRNRLAGGRACSPTASSAAPAGRRGKGVTVRWRAAREASRYAVNVRTSRGLSRLILTRKRKLRIAGIRRGDRVSVSVRGLSEIGLSGARASARLRR